MSVRGPDARLLMLGHCHGVFLVPLVKQVKRHRALSVSVLELATPGSELRGFEDGVYEQVLQAPTPRRLPARLPGRVRRLAERGLEASSRAGSIARRFGRWPRLLDGYDLYHVHCLHSPFLEAVRSLPPGRPVLLSTCGSDLLRQAGVDTYRRHLELCRRADLITVRGTVQREVLLAKFGRDLDRKVRFARFGTAIFPAIDEQRGSDGEAAFRAEHRIDPGRIVVCVGHNAHPENQHLAVIEALKGLDDSWKSRFTLVVPATYGGDSAYVGRIRRQAEDAGFDARVLDEGMSVAEVARLRSSSHVMIQVPISDSLSGAMCETIYAGNVVITGAWLPYLELLEEGIHHHRVQTLGGLPSVLKRILASLDVERREVARNCAKIAAHADARSTVEGWVRVYDELSQIGEGRR